MTAYGSANRCKSAGWSAFGASQVSRTGAGVSSAILPGFTSAGGNVQVTAYGSPSAYCNIGSWRGDDVGATQATVTCRNSAGTLTDSLFTLSYITNL